MAVGRSCDCNEFDEFHFARNSGAEVMRVIGLGPRDETENRADGVIVLHTRTRVDDRGVVAVERGHFRFRFVDCRCDDLPCQRIGREISGERCVSR